MPDDQDLNETIRQSDIYRQYAVTLLEVNAFIYSPNEATDKHQLPKTQSQLFVLGGIANNYMLLRAGELQENAATLNEINMLITKQNKFVNLKIDKKLEYEALKTCAKEIIIEYDRLFLKIGVCK